MAASFATALLFAFSVVFAARSAQWLGASLANLSRMGVALVFLGIWAHGWGEGLDGASLPFFLLSGVIGFGFGDLALYQALPRIGPRLTILLMQCLAAPIAAVAERLWLGTTLTPAQILWSAVILVGVCLALAPAHHLKITPGMRWMGTLFGVLAAAGQGLGAVVSRKAYQVAAGTGIAVDGGTAAYQRLIGGIAVAGRAHHSCGRDAGTLALRHAVDAAQCARRAGARHRLLPAGACNDGQRHCAAHRRHVAGFHDDPRVFSGRGAPFEALRRGRDSRRGRFSRPGAVLTLR